MFLHHVIQTLFLLAGIVALSAAVCNGDWFFNSRNAAPVVNYLGRTKSRWLYGAIGILFIVAAIGFYYHIKSY